MFRAAQSVGPPHVLESNNYHNADIFGGSFEKTCSINPLLTSTSDSTIPDKLLKFPLTCRCSVKRISRKRDRVL